jgi:hypothetical protein
MRNGRARGRLVWRRLIHFGPLPGDKTRYHATSWLDAAMARASSRSHLSQGIFFQGAYFCREANPIGMCGGMKKLFARRYDSSLYFLKPQFFDFVFRLIQRIASVRPIIKNYYFTISVLLFYRVGDEELKFR